MAQHDDRRDAGVSSSGASTRPPNAPTPSVVK
jgi:hypothetical protein